MKMGRNTCSSQVGLGSISLVLLFLGYFTKLSYSFQVTQSVRLASIPRQHTLFRVSKSEDVEETPSQNEILSTKEIPSAEDQSSNVSQIALKRRKMNLSWCSRDDCHVGELREKVVGQHNEIKFLHPATGQVAYQWSDEHAKKTTTTVLILVKRNDDELLKVAADVSLTFSV